MNQRSIVPILFTALGLALLCCAFVQHAKLADLRGQRQQQQREQHAAGESRPLDTTNLANAAPDNAPHAVSSELLKLRNEVGQLTRRRDGLAVVAAENTRLKAQLTSRGTNGAAASGYIRKTEAKFSGYDTPENTLQTFLWAIRNKDYETWLNTLAPEDAEAIRKVERQGPGFSVEKVFEGADAIPGFAIVNPEALRPAQSDGAAARAAEGEQVSVQIQIAPDMPPQEIVFRRVAGQWKMGLPGVGH